MLKTDEWDELLVNDFNPNPTIEDASADELHDNTLITLTIESTERHPLRSRSVSPSTYRGAHGKLPSVVITSIEGETRPRLTRLVVGSSDDEDSAQAHETNTSDDALIDTDAILHRVSDNDSLAGVALRYGVSIAALRRANQLWPSDPVHLRTELVIPRGDTLRVKRKPVDSPGEDAMTTSIVEPASRSSSDLMISTIVAARSVVLSVLPARLSLESLSSKTTASEGHELDDLQAVRARKMSADDGPLLEGGHELSIMAPFSQHKHSSLPPLSQLPCTPVDNHIQSNIPLVGSLHPSSNSFQPRRPQPSAIFLPIRTSQLEPEPAMELPVRRPRT